jgi:hypothetical protein
VKDVMLPMRAMTMGIQAILILSDKICIKRILCNKIMIIYSRSLGRCRVKKSETAIVQCSEKTIAENICRAERSGTSLCMCTISA